MPVLEGVECAPRRGRLRTTGDGGVPSRVGPRGMTLLEIMIVLAILAIVMGILVGPAVIDRWREAKIRSTRIKVMKYANEAFPTWAAQQAGKDCPDSLTELNPYMNSSDARDAWGNPLALRCGARLPPGIRGGIAVSSAGPDGEEGTDDDIASWQ
jgi:general secretion pathway protein G